MDRVTVRELLDGKGKHQFSYVQITSADQAAGIDMIGTGFVAARQEFPKAAPYTHFHFGLPFGAHASATEALRDAFRAMQAGADSIYCAMSPQVVEVLAGEGVPVIAHIGLVPPKSTWVGGYVAVGKTAEQATQVFNQV
jgi:3-methyl-2-oxobutanoate hydroxymethyltransferase